MLGLVTEEDVIPAGSYVKRVKKKIKEHPFNLFNPNSECFIPWFTVRMACYDTWVITGRAIPIAYDEARDNVRETMSKSPTDAIKQFAGTAFIGMSYVGETSSEISKVIGEIGSNLPLGEVPGVTYVLKKVGPYALVYATTYKATDVSLRLFDPNTRGTVQVGDFVDLTALGYCTYATSFSNRGILGLGETKTTQVTSWGDKGITPDLDSGRWVMKGGPTKVNFWKSGLPGPKVVRSNEFPFFRIQKSQADFSNFTTGEVPTSSLKLPPGAEVIKAPLGQRVLK